MPSDVPEPAPESVPVTAPETAPAGPPTSDDRTMGLLCHLGGIIGSFLLPLIVWLIKKDTSAFVNDQGKEALNFQITMLIGWAVAGVLSCVGIGLILFPIIWVLNLVFCVMGAMAANKGERYRYPFNIRILK
ncbi:MAG TPA: DUF4870 domain-containing protein [Fimbriiglobus sp.]